MKPRRAGARPEDVIIETDATIVAPLVFAWALGR